MLAGLPPSDFDLLQGRLALKKLAVGDVLIQTGIPITSLYFVERGIVSLVAQAPDGEQAEVGLVGCEGVVGIPLLLGSDQAPFDGRVQNAGSAWVMSAPSFREILPRSSPLGERLLRYVQTVTAQMAGTALANARYTLAARLARWLLMCHDRVEGDDLSTTHRFLSLMLGVNRTGVTEVVAALERAGVIATKRGTITILDRAYLLTQAGACYGMPEAEYDRLLGSTKSTPTV
ncbi:Crp/Fnr family transcriptional regulator [Methylobacterium sp. E-041]|uniref:Crp/Fnr family transcriptional regulator n=1 Tax=unclassified Methylobacterium TaxID=2615210 RepID=UPI001FB87F1D|nr:MULTISPECIES: Crp/Fnr family transcriptional regulator [unclassified Methylobacterium]MCJ2037381.1 Crp/Fnr family transcriptional regulator [Methylobacterium sp. J-059]MCJ2106531.1 Crp/Fnr family transcriptional regulator [Methylobacterium sp. E-041]